MALSALELRRGGGSAWLISLCGSCAVMAVAFGVITWTMMVVGRWITGELMFF